MNWNFHHFSSPLGIAWIIAKEWSRLLETFRFYNLNLIDAFHIGSVSTDSPRDEILIFLSHYQPPKVSLSIIINNCLWVPWNSTLLYLILFPPGSFIMQLLGQVPSASFTAGMYWLSSFSFVLNYNLHSCIWGEWLEERNTVSSSLAHLLGSNLVWRFSIAWVPGCWILVQDMALFFPPTSLYVTFPPSTLCF